MIIFPQIDAYLLIHEINILIFKYSNISKKKFLWKIIVA